MKASRGMKTGAALLALGFVLLFAGCAALGFDFTSLDTHEYVDTAWESAEAFSAIRIVEDTADISILPSSDGRCRVEVRERQDLPHSIQLQDGTLQIEGSKETNWLNRLFSFQLKDLSLRLYLPAERCAALTIDSSTGDISVSEGLSFDAASIHLSTGDVEWAAACAKELAIDTSTGDVKIQSITAGDVKISVHTGHISLEHVKGECVQLRSTTGRISANMLNCTELDIKSTTGHVILSDAVVQGALSASATTGDIRLEGCDASALRLKTDTGDITGELLSEKLFIAHSDTGRVQVPDTRNGGECRAETDTGNIELTIR